MNLVLSPPLCFLAKRYDKLSSKVVRNALVDFYEPAAISDAKQQLKIDIDSLVVQHGLTGMPRLPRRTEGNNRLVHEVDDIIALFTFADEK